MYKIKFLYILLIEKLVDLWLKYNILIYCEKIFVVVKKRNGIDFLILNWYVYGYYLWIFFMVIWIMIVILFMLFRLEYNLFFIKYYLGIYLWGYGWKFY